MPTFLRRRSGSRSLFPLLPLPPLHATRGATAWLALLVLSLAAPSAAPASVQAPAPAEAPWLPRSLRFDSLVAQQSEMSSSLLALGQDRQGFIWIGTQAGLVRHDGQRVTVYHNVPGDARSLPGDYVGVVFRDRRDRMWFGTSGGLATFDPASGGFTTYRTTPATPATPAEGGDDFVRAIVDDGADGLWLGTTRGLLHFDPSSGKFVAWRHDPARADSLASDRVDAVAVDASGGLWLSAWPAGIDYLAPGAHGFVHYLPDDGAAPDGKRNSVNALRVDRHQQLWIGTAAGVLRWKIGTPWASRQRLPDPAGLGPTWVYQIYEDGAGTVWVGTQPAGLMQWNEQRQQFASYRHHQADLNSLPSSRATAALVDRSGTLWVATMDSGAARVDIASQGMGRVIPAISAGATPVQGNVVGSISPSGAGLWLGGPGGVHWYDPASGQILRSYRHDAARPGTLSSDFVLAVHQQPDGTLWVATADGLNRLDGAAPAAGAKVGATPPRGAANAFRTYRFARQEQNFIRRISPARDGKLWLATEGGVLLFDPASGSAAPVAYGSASPDGTLPGSAGAVLEDRRGRLWIGNPFGNGLLVRDPASGKFRRYLHDARRAGTLSNDFVTCFYEDDAGAVWVGTRHGVNRVSDGADGTLSFDMVGGELLASSYIEGIVGDRSGKLWISSTSALLRFDPAGGQLARYAPSDGILSGDYIDGAAVRGADGTLYFGALLGMTTVMPDAVRSNTIPAQVALVDLAVANRSLRQMSPQALADSGIALRGGVDAPEQLTLAWNQASFSVEFAAMHFAEPERNRYAYRLEGFDRDWVRSDAGHRMAVYTNLAPGRYVFRVKAASKNGVWGEPGLAMTVIVPSPYWATWWFRGVALLATAGVLWLLLRWRLRVLRQRQQELEMLVERRTGDLNQSLRERQAVSDALEAANRQLTALSATDGLTGIANRRRFDQVIGQEWQRALRQKEPLAVGLIDIDHFKDYNDHFGHLAGDEALRLVARALSDGLRRAGDFVARYGGEEFVVVLYGQDAHAARDTLEALRQAVQALGLPASPAAAGTPVQNTPVQNTSVQNMPLQTLPVLTISAGYAVMVPQFDSGADALIEAADRHLYQAKRAGRNRLDGGLYDSLNGRQQDGAAA